MHTGLLDMFHDAADQDVFTIRNGIDIDLDGIIQKTVEQYRRVIRNLHGLAHVACQVILRVHDFHGTSTEHIGRTHHQRITDFIRQCKGLFGIGCNLVGRLQQPQFLHHLLEALTVFRVIDRICRGADNGGTIRFQTTCQFQRRLSAILDDHALRLLDMDDLKHILQGQGFEIQAVGGIVIRRDRLRVAVDHDGLEAVRAAGHGGMHAAVIELDTLPDAVGTTAQHHDLVIAAGRRFAFLFIGGIHVGCRGRELGRTGVNPFVDRPHCQVVTTLTYLALGTIQQARQPTVGKTLALQLPQANGIECLDTQRTQAVLLGHQITDLGKEPGIDRRQLKQLFRRQPGAKAVGNIPEAFRACNTQLFN